MKKSVKAVLSIILVLVLAAGICYPYTRVLPDIVSVGLDYVSLCRNKTAPGKKDMLAQLERVKNTVHPFIIANAGDFDLAKTEYESKSFTEYSEKLSRYVFAAADGLFDETIYPVMPYELDEENSILPISREMINRIVILGYAYRISGEKKYAERAWRELENVCAYDDWCTGHFLATAEMAAAVSIGYDWFYDFLTDEQREILGKTTWDHAIEPALSKNYLKNWFTWSKNNWNSICYSGIGIACMTFADRNPEKAAEFLSMCYKNMPIAFENFTPDGVYSEGPGYCESGMSAIVNFVSSSKNYFGSDFGLSETDGFEQLGSFPLVMSSPDGVFNFGDNKPRACFTPALHWYAAEYNRPALSVYQLQETPEEYAPNKSEDKERNVAGKEYVLSLLWYNRKYEKAGLSAEREPLDLYLKSDVGQPLVVMRSDYFDKSSTYAAIKGGYNYLNHGDLDIGTFVFDSMGERWCEELGCGSYDAPGYFLGLPKGGRWKNYATRAEGQNTLLINPSMHSEDQYVFARCDFNDFKTTDGGAECSLDMTQAYIMNKAKSVNRKFELYAGRTSLKITDDIKCKAKSEIYWFMHTRADMELSADCKSAVLTLNGKRLKAQILADGEFSVMNAEKLGGRYEYDADYPDIKKLTIHLENVKQAVISVSLEPIM